MPTLILTPRFTEDSQLLWRAAMNVGWQIERLHGWRVSDEMRLVPEPVIYCEGLMAPMIAQGFGLRLREPPEDWLPQLPWEYRQRDVHLTILAQARESHAPRFIKPPNDKSFTAGIYTGSELPDFMDDAQPVLVAEPVTWLDEYRCFLLDRQLLSFSVYLRQGELQKAAGYACSNEEEAELKQFVGRLLADQRIPFPRAIVLDVGRIQDRGWAVVELNAAWGSGLYGCDPSRVLKVVRAAMERGE